MRGLPLVAASGGHSSSRCAGLSLSRPLPLRSTGSRRAGSVIVAHGPSCSAACGPRPGLKPMSPALAGRFSTTAPPGKPQVIHFNRVLLQGVPALCVITAVWPRVTMLLKPACVLDASAAVCTVLLPSTESKALS